MKYRKLHDILLVLQHFKMFWRNHCLISLRICCSSFYDAASDAWAEKLQRKVRQIFFDQQSPECSQFATHLGIVTALQDPELRSILALPWNWATRRLPKDYTTYYHGHYLCSGHTREVIAAAAPRMGLTWAAVLATKMITAFGQGM